jgi:pyruvate-formate lyase-activating enzyme
MNIQTISVVVPAQGCVNNCKFCISNQHWQDYKYRFDAIQYRKRIKFAANNNVNTLVLTGTGEVLQNTRFLKAFKEVLDSEGHPFPNVAVQTTGVMLIENDNVGLQNNRELLKSLGVNTISLSVSDIFSDENNWKTNGTPKKLQQPLARIAKYITDAGWTLRMSLNLTDVYDDKTPEEIVARCKKLGAEQITFRKLYSEGTDTPEARWVEEHSLVPVRFYKGNLYGVDGIKNYIKEAGSKLYKLPFGPFVYSLHGMSTVLDDDCMAKDGEADDTLKYVILRENGKLYCRWDDEGSIIF